MYREKLDEKRLELGFSIRKVAIKSGVAYATAYDFFKSNINPRIDTIKRIAVALDVNLTEIF